MTAAITNPSTLKAVYYIKKFSTLNADISSMANWFKQHGVTDVVMESTGKYWIPIRNMRDLCRYLMKLTYIRTSEKNRIQNSMTIAQIRLDSVFSDPFGATASHIMDYILSTPKDQVSKDDIFKLIDHRVIYMTHYA